MTLKSEEYLKSREINFESIYLDLAPHSAQDVAMATGCSLPNVLKTLLFFADENPIIAVVPGDGKTDIAKIEKIFPHAVVRMATPEEVLTFTSYRVGEVSPFGLENIKNRILDKKIPHLDYVLIGTGQNNLLYKLSGKDMATAWDGAIEDIHIKNTNLC